MAAQEARVASRLDGRALRRREAMTTGRTSRRDSAATRTAILDATEAIMREEGYAGVSSRRVAERAGLKSQLVYYHFGAMDDLFLAVYRRTEQAFSQAHARALASGDPVGALWRLGCEPASAAIIQEFLALANHRKAIAREIVDTTLRLRAQQAIAFRQALGPSGADDGLAEALPFVIVSLAQALVSEQSLGVTLGHDAVRRLVERRLADLRPAPDARPA